MAELKDERGNPIHLTDEHGNPVQLTDEFGNPMHIRGVATSTPEYKESVTGNIAEYPTPAGVTAGTGAAATTAEGVAVGETTTGQQQHGSLGEHLRRSGSSSSSSSEDDGQGGRRKKSMKDKIKEKFSSGKHKDEQTPSTATTTGPTTTTGAAVDQPHEKKGILEKIKEKLPGHHNHHP
ncbi:hypothetical protein Bca4012_009747 [Brassica carinata]|uniref:Dehydrin n=1 Tax=Brassica carinata TaxID=52824 RepID=A0A8X7PZH1_BRACI|nr:hypothetical protein Bca52824_078617 [Brassica carinata]